MERYSQATSSMSGYMQDDFQYLHDDSELPAVFIEPVEGSPSPARPMRHLAPGRKIPLASHERLHSHERLPSSDRLSYGSMGDRSGYSDRFPSVDRSYTDRFPSADRSYTSSLDRSQDRGSLDYPYYGQVNLTLVRPGLGLGLLNQLTY